MGLTRRKFLRTAGILAGSTLVNCASVQKMIGDSVPEPYIPQRPTTVPKPETIPIQECTTNKLISLPVYTPDFVAHELSRWPQYAADLVETNLSAPVNPNKINLRLKISRIEGISAESGVWDVRTRELTLVQKEDSLLQIFEEYTSLKQDELAALLATTDQDIQEFNQRYEEYNSIFMGLNKKGLAAVPSEWFGCLDDILARVQANRIEDARDTIAHEFSHAVLDYFQRENSCFQGEGLFTHPEYQGPTIEEITEIFVKQAEPDYFVRQTTNEGDMMKNAMRLFLISNFGLSFERQIIKERLGMSDRTISNQLKEGFKKPCTPAAVSIADAINNKNNKQSVEEVLRALKLTPEESLKAQQEVYERSDLYNFTSEVLARYVVTLMTNYHGLSSGTAFFLDTDMMQLFQRMRFRGEPFFRRNLEIYDVTRARVKEAMPQKGYYTNPDIMRLAADIRERQHYVYQGKTFDWTRSAIVLEGAFQKR